MIVLDTNVISELMRRDPEPNVLRWTNNREPQLLFTTAITAAELLSGIEQMPAGQKRDELGQRMKAALEEGFRGRILPFDQACAKPFARIFAHRRAIGRRIEEPDAMIAAICSLHRLKIATRDTGGFTGCGIDIINPWTE